MVPDTKVSVREVFGLDQDMECPAFRERTAYVPDIDPAYRFNPETTLEYTLSSSDRVRITIYDARGSVVRRLVDEIMPAGRHSVLWNGIDEAGRPASSGIYFVKMAAGSHVETRKIVLLK